MTLPVPSFLSLSLSLYAASAYFLSGAVFVFAMLVCSARMPIAYHYDYPFISHFARPCRLSLMCNVVDGAL